MEAVRRLGSWCVGVTKGAVKGAAVPGSPVWRLGADFVFTLGQAGGGGAVPNDCGWAPGELIRKSCKSHGLNFTCHREGDVERDRERKQARDQSPGKVLPRLGAIIKM